MIKMGLAVLLSGVFLHQVVAFPNPKTVASSDSIIGDWRITNRYGHRVNKEAKNSFIYRFTLEGSIYRITVSDTRFMGTFSIRGSRLIIIPSDKNEPKEAYDIKSISKDEITLSEIGSEDECTFERCGK
jgi:hypothetical protein